MTESAGLVPFRQASWDVRLREVRHYVRPALREPASEGAA
jgi:hypothetical protein